jgi:hypothetical protein
MIRVHLRSSVIEWAAYDPASQRMQIKFRKNPAVVEFRSVPWRVWEGFRRASSHGAFYLDHIKDLYDCQP